jgi:tripartite-type tricarboxylate transporter receptor subunit TctC
VTRPTSGIDTLANLVARAKANPGVLSYASPGVGTSSQLAVELLKQRTNIDIRHVPFNGSGMSLMAALSGATDIAALNTLGLVRHIQAGELKALAQTGSRRWSELPDVPTMSEAGVSNAALETSLMLLAPAGTPYPIIKRLAKRTEEILEQPDIAAELLKTGFIVAYEGPEALRSRLEREAPVWHEMVDHAGLNKKSR